MLHDSRRVLHAAEMLAQAAGFLRESGYLDGQVEWSGGAIFGARFLYYHELGHALRALDELEFQIRLHPEEETIAEEIYADLFALGMITMELRNQPVDTQVVGFSGIAFAMSFIALSEYSQNFDENGVTSIRKSVYRMGRIRHHFINTSVSFDVSERVLVVMNAYWTEFTDLLREIRRMPSPMAALLHRTAKKPRVYWSKARDEIIKWCVFGDCDRVRSSFVKVFAEAQFSGYSEVLNVANYILEQTHMLEPELGLVKAIEELRSIRH